MMLGRQFDGVQRPLPSMLFHGTSQEFQPGDVIHPAAALGPSAGNSERNPHMAYATADLRDAHQYANAAARGGGQPQVYHVEPVSHEGLSLENVGARRRDGFTNVGSTQGFRVVGKAPAPKTAPRPFTPPVRSRFRPQPPNLSLAG